MCIEMNSLAMCLKCLLVVDLLNAWTLAIQALMPIKYSLANSLKNSGLRTFIEIVPLKSQSFNIISQIQFLDYLADEFVCNFKSIYKNSISFSCCNKNNLRNKTQIINITVANDLESIHVYERDQLYNNSKLKSHWTPQFKFFIFNIGSENIIKKYCSGAYTIYLLFS